MELLCSLKHPEPAVDIIEGENQFILCGVEEHQVGETLCRTPPWIIKWNECTHSHELGDAARRRNRFAIGNSDKRECSCSLLATHVAEGHWGALQSECDGRANVFVVNLKSLSPAFHIFFGIHREVVFACRVTPCYAIFCESPSLCAVGSENLIISSPPKTIPQRL